MAGSEQLIYIKNNLVENELSSHFEKKEKLFATWKKMVRYPQSERDLEVIAEKSLKLSIQYATTGMKTNSGSLVIATGIDYESRR